MIAAHERTSKRGAEIFSFRWKMMVTVHTATAVVIHPAIGNDSTAFRLKSPGICSRTLARVATVTVVASVLVVPID